jgi:hypothetical protein
MEPHFITSKLILVLMQIKLRADYLLLQCVKNTKSCMSGVGNLLIAKGHIGYAVDSNAKLCLT